jgi:hypothetical protein
LPVAKVGSNDEGTFCRRIHGRTHGRCKYLSQAAPPAIGQTTAIIDVRRFEFRASGRQPIDLSRGAAFQDKPENDDSSVVESIELGTNAV